ncbi:hypothetical protein C0991_000926, partial [Blastosporella zonata]
MEIRLDRGLTGANEDTKYNERKANENQENRTCTLFDLGQGGRGRECGSKSGEERWEFLVVRCRVGEGVTVGREEEL